MKKRSRRRVVAIEPGLTIPSDVECTSWTGEPPEPGSPFFQRIAYVLNHNKHGMQLALDLSDDDLDWFWKANASGLPDMDQDEIWDKIEARVSQQVALGLALREEMRRMLAKQRETRLARRMAVTER